VLFRSEGGPPQPRVPDRPTIDRHPDARFVPPFQLGLKPPDQTILGQQLTEPLPFVLVGQKIEGSDPTVAEEGGHVFVAQQPGQGRVGAEQSPFGVELEKTLDGPVEQVTKVGLRMAYRLVDGHPLGQVSGDLQSSPNPGNRVVHRHRMALKEDALPRNPFVRPPLLAPPSEGVAPAVGDQTPVLVMEGNPVGDGIKKDSQPTVVSLDPEVADQKGPKGPGKRHHQDGKNDHRFGQWAPLLLV